MRTSLVKLAAALLALMLVLSGCSMIEVNQAELVRDEIKAAKEQLSGVLAEYDGGQITQADVQAAYNGTANYYYQIYQSLYGTGLNQDLLDDLKKTTVEEAVSNVAILKEFEARGLELEDPEQVKAEAEEAYQSNMQAALDASEGKTDEEKQARAELLMVQAGISEEGLYQSELAEHASEVLRENVEAEVEDLTEDEVKALYDEKVSEDETTYGEHPEDYGSDTSNGITAYWVPEGYRRVKHILIAPEEEVLTAMTDARSAVKTAEGELADLETELETAKDAADDETEAAEDEAAEETEEAATEEADAADTEDPTEAVRSAEEIQADIDAKKSELEDLKKAREEAETAAMANIQDTVDEVYARLEAGDSFDDVMAEYGEDPGMKSEPGMSQGYAICAASTNMVAEFVEGSMALEKVGDYSAKPVMSDFGAHIIYYDSDVTSGPVEYESVRDEIFEDAMDDKRSEHYDESLQSWVDALKPVYHLENWVEG